MAKCKRCDKPALFMSELCPECIEAGNWPNSPTHPAEGAPSALAGSAEGQPRRAGNPGLCVGLGVIFLLIGAYFLLLGPSEGDSEFLGRSVVNVHRLYLGQTSAIIGAIFLAVGIRPR